MLTREFFQTDPVTCARKLVGATLVWGESRSLIAETEAYGAIGDEACHTWSRPSARAFVENHPAGTAYVYFNYGMHWMLNVLVKGRKDGFVLFRALEPLRGLESMHLARGVKDPLQLCSGPGKLARALGVTGADHGRDLCDADGPHIVAAERKVSVVSAPRVGISRAQELPWRFCLKGCLHVSRPRPK